MIGRLPAHLEASALIRRAEADGGFGTVIASGDPDRGSLLLMVSRRGEHQACLERTLAPDGSYRWERVGPGLGAEPSALADWSQKRRRFDEDSWLIELDIAEPERFIAEMASQG